MTIINSVIKGKQPVIDTLNVTPTTSAQQITAPSGTDGYSPVNVSAVTSSIDANIVAGNIKKDVQILGVTGSYEGTVPTGTVNITSNGTHNVSSYEYAEVLVPTTAPAYYIEKTKDANGKAQNGSYLMDFSTFTDVGDYVFECAYDNNLNISGTVDMSSIVELNGRKACNYMFYGCTGITGVDLSNLTKVIGQYACQYMFYGCTGITGIIDLSLLNYVVNYGCDNMFYGCTGITSVDLSELSDIRQNSCNNMFYGCTGITGRVSLPKLYGSMYNNACSAMFSGCTGITSIGLENFASTSGSSSISSMFSGCTNLERADLDSLTCINGSSSAGYMFSGCTKLANISVSKIAKINGSNAMLQTFKDCTSLTSLSFNNLTHTATSFNNAFGNTLLGCSNVTVHFPAEWQTTMSSWSNITNGMGGTNTTILFDLPNITTLDLSHLTKISAMNEFSQFAMNNYFDNIDSVNMSNVVEIDSIQNGCHSMFKGCSNIINVNLGSLTKIKGTTSCQNMFQDCANLANVSLQNLIEINGANVCNYMFSGCTTLTTINLSTVVDVIGQSACSSMFMGCTGITTVDLSSLKNIDGTQAVGVMFSGCSSLTEVKFPALKYVLNYSVFQNMLNGTSGVTVHFPSNFATTVTSNTLGGTGTTVLYDLPAVVVLTGADTKEYERNPKYDTGTALAWRINGTMPNTTTYYTSGLTDPTVGTTIYSDSACTIAETTVDSIA